MSTTTKVSQGEHRRGVDVGPTMTQVTPVATWYRGHQFKSDEEARGAFRLAYQQGCDGMGQTIGAWMGLSDAEYDAWRRDETLPAR